MKTYLVMGLAAIIVLGGGWYYLQAGKTAETVVTSTSNETGDTSNGTQTAQSGSFSGSLNDLASRSGDWQCTINTQTDDVSSSGTVYVSAGKVRADFTSAVPNYGNVHAYMIADGINVYSWSSVMPQGIKTKMTATAQGGAQTSGQGVDMFTNYDYNCLPWVREASKFEIPSTVTFMEIGV